jgi:hypothetical protein
MAGSAVKMFTRATANVPIHLSLERLRILATYKLNVPLPQEESPPEPTVQTILDGVVTPSPTVILFKTGV